MRLLIIICVTVILPNIVRTDAVLKRKKKFVPQQRPSDCYQLLCNTTAHYPGNHIKKMLNKHKRIYDDMFGTVIEPIDKIKLPTLRSAVYQEDVNLCETRQLTIFPKVAYDTNMEPQFIVNIEDHEQSVTFETCLSSECSLKKLLNYETSCKQLYTVIRLLYLTSKGELKFGRFSVPSTCVCTYSKIIY